MLTLKSSDREQFQLDLVPMINVIFLLLIFFMLTASAITKDLEVDLPEAKSAEKNLGENITVSVAPGGSIEVNGQAMRIESLLAVLKKELGETAQKVVVIRADKNTEFDLFGKIIDIATQAGAADFMLATEPTETMNINQPG